MIYEAETNEQIATANVGGTLHIVDVRMYADKRHGWSVALFVVAGLLVRSVGCLQISFPQFRLADTA